MVKKGRKHFYPVSSANYKPEFAYVVVQKRINLRIFSMQNRARVNAPPGTVVDYVVTCVKNRNIYDFFLVPQKVNEGTVTPTHFVSIFFATVLVCCGVV